MSIQVGNGAAGEADLEAGACETFTLPMLLSHTGYKSEPEPAKERSLSCPDSCQREDVRAPPWFTEEP